MGSDTAAPITQLVLRWNSGEESCLDQLVALVEHELRQVAYRQMRKQREGHTLQTTALVNEACLKLVDQSRANWQDRAQFLGIASSLMRRTPVDHARGFDRAKRGGIAGHLPLDEDMVFSPAKAAALVLLAEAVQQVAGLNPRKAQVVELRYFAGLSLEEVAEALRVHPKAFICDWGSVGAWFKGKLRREVGCNAT